MTSPYREAIFSIIESSIGDAFDRPGLEAIVHEPRKLADLVDRLRTYSSDQPVERKMSNEVQPWIYMPHVESPVFSMGRRHEFPPRLTRITTLLMYSHRVVIQDPVPAAVSRFLTEDPNRTGDFPADAEFALVLGWLLAVKPLVEAGIIVLRAQASNEPKMSREEWEAHYATASSIANDVDLSVPDLQPAFDRAMTIYDSPDDFEASGHVSSVASEFIHASRRGAQFGADIWIAGPVEAAVQNAIYRHMARPGSSARDLPPPTFIENLDMPAIGALTAKDIVDIRRDEEVFEGWRKALRESLGTIPSLSERPASRDELIAARQLLIEAHAALERERKKHRSIFTETLQTFGFSVSGGGFASLLLGVNDYFQLALAAAGSGATSLAYRGLATRSRRAALIAADKHFAIAARIS